MDLLKRELQRKRKAVREDFAGKSFVRRSELEQKRLQKSRDEHHHHPNAGGALAPSLESAAPASDPSGNPYADAAAGDLNNNPTSCSNSASASEPSLPRHEVIRRLRVLREPVTLFGEDDAARVQRLGLALKSSVVDDVDDLHRARGGQTNDFLGDMVEMGKRRKFARDAYAKSVSGGAGGDGNGGGRSEIDDADDADKDSKFDELCKEDKILVFFSALLSEWKREVDGMSEPEKRTASGKTKVERFNQSAGYLGPLFELCRKKILPDDIREALLDIIECCMRHDYQQAMEQYIKLAIGNAPWPIGVTMVGIHERSAREKICTNSVAHIMNDETTRRYLQSIKRLMTLCEPRYLTLP